MHANIKLLSKNRLSLAEYQLPWHLVFRELPLKCLKSLLNGWGFYFWICRLRAQSWPGEVNNRNPTAFNGSTINCLWLGKDWDIWRYWAFKVLSQFCRNQKYFVFGSSQRGSSKNNLDEENTEDMSPMFTEQHIFTFSWGPNISFHPWLYQLIGEVQMRTNDSSSNDSDDLSSQEQRERAYTHIN